MGKVEGVLSHTLETRNERGSLQTSTSFARGTLAILPALDNSYDQQPNSTIIPGFFQIEGAQHCAFVEPDA